ncbi:SWIM zinc finger family protein [Cellulosilyticum sp. ST5]|uniref:SWIM zinc finger family protein n=1 Tax=Cellulosilyticum sp. ST5 TaxID=3055805 RepID=UPI0039773772
MQNITDLLNNNARINVKKLVDLKALRSFEFRGDNSQSANTDFFDLEIINTDADQKKRFEKACSTDVKPVSIESKENYGIFKGSGKAPYMTTLEDCTCTDFKRRKRPCKHMYRLAVELGVINTNSK